MISQAANWLFSHIISVLSYQLNKQIVTQFVHTNFQMFLVFDSCWWSQSTTPNRILSKWS